VGAGRVTDFVYDWDRIAFGRAAIAFEGMDLDAHNGFLAWSENLRHEGVADLSFPPGSPLLQTATGGRVRGSLHLHVEARGDFADPRFQLKADSPSLAVGPLDLGSVSLAVSGGRDETGRYAFQGIRATTDGPLGKAGVSGGTFHPFGSAPELASDLSGVLEADGIDLPDLVRALGGEPPGLPMPTPHVISGRLQTRLEVWSWAQRMATLQVAGEAGMTLPPGTLLAGTDAVVRLDAEATTEGTSRARPCGWPRRRCGPTRTWSG
jgi:hypothetical protein